MNDEKKEAVGKKQVYDPPKAMRLSEDEAGKGTCFAGSANLDLCDAGNEASACGPGSSASF